MTKKLLLALGLLLCAAAGWAQQRSTEEFLASAGFSLNEAGEWAMGTNATVAMEGNSVKAFTAKQTHNWDLTFGNGKQGTVVHVKKGDVLTFADGRLTFADGSAYCPASTDEQVLFTRGILRSAIFNAARTQLFATDIKTVNPADGTLGTFIAADGTTNYKMDASGNFTDKLAADRAALSAKREQSYRNATKAYENAEQREYEEMCRKYGKSVIDRTLRGEIVVGAPIDLVRKCLGYVTNGYDISYCNRLVSAHGALETLEFSPEVYASNEWHVHYFVTYNRNTQKVTSYYTRKKYY